jgi:hypothetical protein
MATDPRLRERRFRDPRKIAAADDHRRFHARRPQWNVCRHWDVVQRYPEPDSDPMKPSSEDLSPFRALFGIAVNEARLAAA